MRAVGTPLDTPVSLRRKSAEFLRLAAEAADADMVEELRRLAEKYLRYAEHLESGAGDGPANDDE